jgi:hypothetical protein
MKTSDYDFFRNRKMLCFIQSFYEEFGEVLDAQYGFTYEKEDGNSRGMTLRFTIPADFTENNDSLEGNPLKVIERLEDVIVPRSNIGQGAVNVTVNSKPKGKDRDVTIAVFHDIKTLELARYQRQLIKKGEHLGR